MRNSPPDRTFSLPPFIIPFYDGLLPPITASLSDHAHSEVASTPSVDYDTNAFRRSLDDLSSGGATDGGTCVLFCCGSRKTRQEAVGTLTRYATGNVHQFRVPSLLSEYRMQTQNSLRKAFDHAAEERALLYFDEVGALVAHNHTDTPTSSARTTPTTTEYFSDRVDAYPEIVVLGLQQPGHLEWASTMADLIVQFE